MEFQAGWYADPVFFGHYPQSMIDAVGDRLPTFTPEQSERIKGSYDFYGTISFVDLTFVPRLESLYLKVCHLSANSFPIWWVE